LKNSTLVSVWPISAIELNRGWVAGSHMMTSGSTSKGVMTPVTGWPAEFWIASSSGIMPSVIERSTYIWAETCWNPIAGPPARISIRTPVSAP
jgi:hypothetical protein